MPPLSPAPRKSATIEEYDVEGITWRLIEKNERGVRIDMGHPSSPEGPLAPPPYHPFPIIPISISTLPPRVLSIPPLSPQSLPPSLTHSPSLTPHIPLRILDRFICIMQKVTGVNAKQVLQLIVTGQEGAEFDKSMDFMKVEIGGI